ncbi:MAG TPA: hypothetical protein VH063_06525 [Gaiellaceae bacterium]|jgi:hypothetical protein|nr:hypothetical protein [Gaiellaceae bacterium]
MPRPNPNVSLRLPPFAKQDFDAIIKQLVSSQGHDIKQADLVGVLIERLRPQIGSPKIDDKLGQEIRDFRKRAAAVGY